MIRFLILCIVFLLLYIGFNAIADYDFAIELIISDYQVTSTLFTFIATFFVTQIILMICLKSIFLVLDLPQILKNKWQKRKLQKVNQKLLIAIAELLMSNKSKSLGLTNKLIPSLDKTNNEVINLIKAEVAKDFEQKIQFLKKLLNKKHYSIYAAKKISELFYQNMHYKQAEEYALKAFNENDSDTEIIIMLIRIYSSLGAWNKLVFLTSKLQRANSKLLEKYSEEIAGYYFAAAKFHIQSGSNNECLNYLESALELKPDCLEALNLFTELSTNTKNTVIILKILKNAFLAKPCFEIARMYIASSRSSPDAMYGTLASLVLPSKYPDLFLALAAYLNLPDKIAEIKEQKLIS